MRRATAARARRERGNAIVEFAVMAPLLAVLFFGVIQTAFYGVAFVSVENAARAAAMRNSFGTDSAADQSAACTIVTEELASVLKTSGALPTPGCSSAPLVVESKLCGNGVACSGTQMSADGKPAASVTVRLTLPSWIPLPFISQIVRRAEMKVRQLS